MADRRAQAPVGPVLSQYGYGVGNLAGLDFGPEAWDRDMILPFAQRTNGVAPSPVPSEWQSSSDVMRAQGAGQSLAYSVIGWPRPPITQRSQKLKVPTFSHAIPLLPLTPMVYSQEPTRQDMPRSQSQRGHLKKTTENQLKGWVEAASKLTSKDGPSLPSSWQDEEQLAEMMLILRQQKLRKLREKSGR